MAEAGYIIVAKGTLPTEAPLGSLVVGFDELNDLQSIDENGTVVKFSLQSHNHSLSDFQYRDWRNSPKC